MPIDPENELPIRNIPWYGWSPDAPDQRDVLYAAPAPYQKETPDKVDLRGGCPPVYDQGRIGSCTANAIAAAIEFDQKKLNLPKFTPSRLFIYYSERLMENTIASDAGARIRDGIKSVAKIGAPHESAWPYENVEANFSVKPPQQAYDDAKQHLILLYQRLVHELTTLKGCLASGFPFVFGFTCYESFEGNEVAKTGILPMPRSREKTVGGHAVLCVGYDDDTQQFIVRNSWGADWGQAGYFMMPYAYLTNHRLTSDFWTIRSVE